MPGTAPKTAPAGTRPEVELLLCCARTDMDAGQCERVKVLLQTEMDWEYLLRISLGHGLQPLLYRHVAAICPEAVPWEALGQLHRQFHTNAGRSLFLTRELLKLLELFASAGIAAVPFKGPVLAHSVYGDPALRVFGDLDLLVHRQDIPGARELLISHGYRPLVQLKGAQEAWYLLSEYELPFVQESTGVIVELHWTIVGAAFAIALDPEALWERLEQTSLAGRTMLTFPPEVLLLLLCVHGTKHCWERVNWLCDLAQLLAVHPGLDWGQVAAQARYLRCERMLRVSLHLADGLLGTPLPADIAHWVQADPVAKALAGQISHRLFREGGGLSGVFMAFFHLLVRERLRDRLPYARNLIGPNETDRAALRLPPFLSWLYYVLRPIRLARKWAGELSRQRRPF